MESPESFPDMSAFVGNLLGAGGEISDVAADSLVVHESSLYIQELLQSDLQTFLAEDFRLEETSKDLHAGKAALVLEVRI